MTDIFERLAAPFPPERVSWRVGSTNLDKNGNPPQGKAPRGMALAYIDARDVMDRLDEVVGPAGWQCRYSHANGKTVCEIDIWVEGRGWVMKSDGAGDTDYEADKGALSDAFKRAAVRWGVGRYLYHLSSPWVDIEPKGRTAIIKPDELRKLEALLSNARPTTPPPAPEESGLYIACKAAIDLAQSEADLTAWATSNTASMANIEKEAPAVYTAIRRYYASKLNAFRKAAA